MYYTDPPPNPRLTSLHPLPCFIELLGLVLEVLLVVVLFDVDRHAH